MSAKPVPKKGAASSEKTGAAKIKSEPVELDGEGLSSDGLSLDKPGFNPMTQIAATERLFVRKGSKLEEEKLAAEALKAEKTAAGIDTTDEFEIIHEEVRDPIVDDPIFTNKGNKYPQIHGNYFLLDHLVDGGMAKICRARYLGEGDQVDKMVVIKMVQEKFSSDPDFTAMFIDEIKVSFGLQHPNISTTYDYGKIGKNLFVAMEYIHGKDLNKIIQTFKGHKKAMPIPMAIWIASKMCEGLHYAHNFTNKLTGENYNIVHRDISPHNVMISYEGYIKVIDFGIAKASTNQQEEQQGTIKGKINYFAPEYLEGKPINHTYDQFSVGLTLWEMLTGKRTFNGDNQINTLKLILACVPENASKYNKAVKKELDAIVNKALSRDPKDRYENLMAMNKDLLKLLYSQFSDFHETDIVDMMKEMFSEDLQEDESKFREWGQFSIGDIVEKIKKFKEYLSNEKEKRKDKPQQRKEELIFDFDDANQVSVLSKSDVTGQLGANDMESTAIRRVKNQSKDAFQQQLMGQLAIEKPSGKKKGATQTRTNLNIKAPPKNGRRKVIRKKKKSSIKSWLVFAATIAAAYVYRGPLEEQVKALLKDYMPSITTTMSVDHDLGHEGDGVAHPDNTKMIRKADALLEKLKKQEEAKKRAPSQE